MFVIIVVAKNWSLSQFVALIKNARNRWVPNREFTIYVLKRAEPKLDRSGAGVAGATVGSTRGLISDSGVL